MQKILTIDSNTGEITTIIDNAFDYETQTEVYVQIQAEDTLGPNTHKVVTQLQINVIDVNDEKPRIQIVSKRN